MATMIRCRTTPFGAYNCEPITLEQDDNSPDTMRKNTQLVPIPRLFSWSRFLTRWYVIYSYSFPTVRIYYPDEQPPISKIS